MLTELGTFVLQISLASALVVVAHSVLRRVEQLGRQHADHVALRNRELDIDQCHVALRQRELALEEREADSGELEF